MIRGVEIRDSLVPIDSLVYCGIAAGARIELKDGRGFIPVSKHALP